jgi:hypothetical protein
MCQLIYPPLAALDKGSGTTSKAGLKEYLALRSQSGWQRDIVQEDWSAVVALW